MVRVTAVHTAMALVEPLTKIFREILPEVKLNHIADDSLIQEVIANNKVTPAVKRRLLAYYLTAADNGSDVVFNCCSSVGDIADLGDTIAPIPVFRIDWPMAMKAVTAAKRIAVVSTLGTTLDPTRRLLERCAKECGKDVELIDALADGAFAAGQSGDGATHDRLIQEAAEKVADKVDIFVLAQGSMARMEQKLAEITGKPVLSSPVSGVEGLKLFLQERGMI